MNEQVNRYKRIESYVKDLRLYEYTIVLFADVRSVRHSDSNATRIEKKSRNERRPVRRKGGITPLCADELSPTLIKRGTTG